MKPLHVTIGLAAVLVLGGCATIPTGPSTMALPGTGKTFEQFRFDDGECQRYAFQQIGGMTAEKAAEESAVRSAVSGPPSARLPAPRSAAGAARGSEPARACFSAPWRGRMRASVRPTVASGGTTMPTSSACMPAATRSRYPPRWPGRCSSRRLPVQPIRRRPPSIPGRFPNRRRATRHRHRRAINARSIPPAGPQRAA